MDQAKCIRLLTLFALLATSCWQASAQVMEQYIPLLVYRTGPYGSGGAQVADGMGDYFKLLNTRDGGINGVSILSDECDTAYNTDRGVECYERLKNRGPQGASLMFPYSTGATYALIERSRQDRIPLHTMGYGRTDASDGRVFPYVFTVPNTYWSAASSYVIHVANEEGGIKALAGKKIMLIYHDSAYGKEPIRTLQAHAERYGFHLATLPVSPPGVEQRATWLQVRRQKPDWIILWSWGIMTATAIREAAAVRFPRNRIIASWWAGSETDVAPLGKIAKGYRAGTFNATGIDFPVHADLRKHVFDKGNATGSGRHFGTVLYNRGIINAMIATEAVRRAQQKYGVRAMTGDEVRWGYENLDVSEVRLAELGMSGFVGPMSINCADHEGTHDVLIQQWDGKHWNIISDWISPVKDLVRPMIESSALAYAEEKGITPRDCSAAE